MKHLKLVPIEVIITIMLIIVLGIIFIVGKPTNCVEKSSKDDTIQLLQETELSETNSVSKTIATIKYVTEFEYKGHTYLKFGNGITHAGHCPACRRPFHKLIDKNL